MKFVKLVFENPEAPGGGPITPDPVTPDPVTPDPVTPDPPADPDEPAAGTPEAGLRAAAKAERVKRQTAEAAAQTAREEAAYYRGIAERPAAAPTPATPAAPAGPPEAPVEPEASQFEEYEDFEAAHRVFKQAERKYVIEVAKHEMRQEYNNQSQQATRQQTEAQITTAFNKRLADEAALDPDIVNLANTFHLPGPNQIPLTGPMQDAIRESDVGPRLLRHFANNKVEVVRLAGMSPATQLREIGRIEASIINKPQPVVKHVSAAPDPVKPLGGNGQTDVDDDKIPMSEYLARERLRKTERQKRS
jgi:hypothetical protein